MSIFRRRRLLSIVAGLTLLQQSAGCTDLWKGSLVENPKNCAIAPAICSYSEECDYSTERCVPLPPPSCPAIAFESVTPQSGSRVGGEKITITGSNFQGNMRVEIDGTPLDNVVVETSSQLSGRLSASLSSCGTSPVTVISSCFERVSKERAFYYSLDPLEFDNQPQVLPAPPSASPQQILLEDMNADGDPDVIGIEAGAVRSYLSDGNGSFTTSNPITLLGNLFQAAVGDVNGDKALDLIITDAASPRLWLLLNNGRGVLSAISIAMPEPMRGVASDDLNADGKEDALAVGLGGTLYLLGGSASGLAGPTSVATGLPGNSQLVTLADVTADAQPELIVAGGSAQVIEVWQKNGPTAFARLSQTAVSAAPYSVAAGDIDGDGNTDVIGSLVGQKNVAILRGKGGGLFASEVIVSTGVMPRTVQLVDVNCDGKLDLFASSATENKLALLLGTKTGTLAAATTIDLSAQQPGIAQALFVKDVNFDGTPDLVVGSSQNPAYLLIANVSP